ncbi:MAG: naphthalene dioxygenase ferredoxin [Verrucomicrobia bacterium]|nr:naphthalene dioxygenase ferredoxin [Verrucomicrobiota bacterium]
MSETWINACAPDDIAIEDVIRFDLGERSFAVYRTGPSAFHVTDGFCTHAHVHLADGFVMGTVIECPKHNGRFDCVTGKAIRKPACVDLVTYPVKVENGRVFFRLVE